MPDSDEHKRIGIDNLSDFILNGILNTYQYRIYQCQIRIRNIIIIWDSEDVKKKCLEDHSLLHGTLVGFYGLIDLK